MTGDTVESTERSSRKDPLEVDRLRSIYDSVAARYDRQHWLTTAGTDEQGRELVVDHAVQEGDEVLDAGAGTGSTALLAARRVGPTGHVTLFDLSPHMLAKAEEKFEHEGLLDRATFVTGDVLDMPFPDGRFDVVLSTYSACPLYDPAEGVREMYRVLRPGGSLGVAHSTEPANLVVRWVAHRLEDGYWHLPEISLGCRPVSVLPELREAGAVERFTTRLGVPFWPFLVFVVEKPADDSPNREDPE